MRTGSPCSARHQTPSPIRHPSNLVTDGEKMNASAESPEPSSVHTQRNKEKPLADAGISKSAPNESSDKGESRLIVDFDHFGKISVVRS